MTPRQRDWNYIFFLNEVKKACKKGERPLMNHLCKGLGISRNIQIVLQNNGVIKRVNFAKYEWIKDIELEKLHKEIILYNRNLATRKRERKKLIR
jgi:hypothetical protein